MKSSHVKASVASYFRYKKQCPLITFERPLKHNMGQPDILVITKNRKIVEVEVKVSLSDFKNDTKKKIWNYRSKLPDLYPMPYQFYYAVPEKLKDKALAVMEAWDKQGLINGRVGLMIVIDRVNIGWGDVEVVKKCPINKKSYELSTKDMVKIVKDQTGTLCSCMVKIAKMENNRYFSYMFQDGQGI